MSIQFLESLQSRLDTIAPIADNPTIEQSSEDSQNENNTCYYCQCKDCVCFDED